ncbi:hypothetical protein AB0N05_32075 [Nocardia sp. NPDC051030]|uniref:hypothetical protein n=1 Tax=Nocardia sp. NPDC051030 TaxID=3155162 RepID=UPI0034400619
MNPWAWRDRNPYYQTAFQVLDIEPTADRATVRSRIAARRKRISYDAKRFPLFGEILTVAQINAAEEQLATPRTRAAAELLTHRPEPAGDDLADLTELLELSRTLSAATETGPAETHTGSDLRIDYHVLPRLLPSPNGDPLGTTSAETTA